MFKKLALAVAVSLAVPAASMACEGHQNARREKMLKKQAAEKATAEAPNLPAEPDQVMLAQAATGTGSTTAASTTSKKRKPKASQTSSPTTTAPATTTPAPAK